MSRRPARPRTTIATAAAVAAALMVPAGGGASAAPSGPSSASRDTVDAWVERWQDAGRSRLLFTKVDEATDLEELVRAPARRACPITWFTTGQRVPEDIEEADSGRLLTLAKHGLEVAE